MLWTVVGSVATASSTAFAVPHLANYNDQLAALASSLQDGMPFRNRLDDSVAKAELIDCYRRTRHDVDTSSRPLVSRGLADHPIHQLGPDGALGLRFAFFSDPDSNGWSI
jgi:hypothetical protein